ncbi:MAG: sulfate adenylyltransferase subunit 1 [Acidiferrobacter sp.]
MAATEILIEDVDREAPAPSKDLLRFITAGSVDDGKSTLIGRLLHDARALMEDQIDALARASGRRGFEGLDLSYVTDGLQGEREQGITIDVAYRSFETARRRFIIADTPGHEQYTRNMVTGATNADVAVILVDACKYWLPQSRRHACIADTVGIRHLIVAVNKMDLIGYCQGAFEHIRDEFRDFAARLHFERVVFIPISALKGDMIVERGANLPWYEGPTLLEALEEAEVPGAAYGSDQAPLRLPVQWVSRPGGPGRAGRRGYMGRIVSGSVAAGDEVVILPSGRVTHVEDIETYDGVLARAHAPQSVTVHLEDDVDVARGDMIVAGAQHPVLANAFEATVCWLGSEPMSLRRRRYFVKHGAKTVAAVLSRPRYRLDITTLARDTQAATLALNDIGRVTVRVQEALSWDPYAVNRATGAFIVVDALTNDTVAAGMIEGPAANSEVVPS